MEKAGRTSSICRTSSRFACLTTLSNRCLRMVSVNRREGRNSRHQMRKRQLSVLLIVEFKRVISGSKQRLTVKPLAASYRDGKRMRFKTKCGQADTAHV